MVERPRVLYNDLTQRFVMWMHIDTGDYELARCGMAISASPTGVRLMHLMHLLPSYPLSPASHRRSVILIHIDTNCYKISVCGMATIANPVTL